MHPVTMRNPRSPRSLLSPHPHGFTLVELLVALALMAVLATLSWRVLDGMARAQAITLEHTDRDHQWQSALAQWRMDLDAILDSESVPPLDFDGRVLRLTRPSSSGGSASPRLLVVAWGLQPDPASPDGSLRWTRWVSPPLSLRSELEQAWQQAEQWGHAPALPQPTPPTLMPAVQGWQVFFHRHGAWSNPLSSAGNNEDTGQKLNAVPDGIRLVLTLPETNATLVKDWARPNLGGSQP